MGPVEAFKKLGYPLANAYDWSVCNENGLCISLWRDEISWKREATAVFDTTCDSGPGPWREDSKAAKRLRQLEAARSNWGGRIDVVIRDGTPDRNPGTAEAWKRPGCYWKCDYIDAEKGNFVVRLYVS